jgi:hypothetical protein
MPTTPELLLPYPAPTDPADVPADMAALANRLEVVTLPKTLVDAKGDLIAATGNDAAARVAVGTDGQVLTADTASAAGVKWAAPLSGASYGTSLPGSPTDGQEHVLVDSLTAPTYQWRFRYHTAATGNKWEFIGGTALYAFDGTISAITPVSPSYGSLAPSVTVPRAGRYQVRIIQRAYNAATAGTVNSWLGLVAPGVASPGPNPSVQTCTGQNFYFNHTLERQIDVNAAGTIQGQYANSAGTVTSADRSIMVIPVSVA